MNQTDDTAVKPNGPYAQKQVKAPSLQTSPQPASKSQDGSTRTEAASTGTKVVGRVVGRRHVCEVEDYGEGTSQFYRYIVRCSCAWNSRQYELLDAMAMAERHCNVRVLTESPR